MKAPRIIAALSLATAITIAVGCSKTEETPAPASAPPAEGTTEKAPAEMQKQAETAAATATEAAATASSQAQGLIDQAKSLVDSGKYADASKLVQELASMKLTPEQQKIVDDLKALIQQKMADQATSEGAKAAGEMLGK